MRRWLTALAVTGLAVALRWALNPWLGDGNVPYITLFVAILFAGLHAGLWAGLACVGVGAVAADYFFLKPVRSVGIDDPAMITGMIVYLLVGMICAALGSVVRRLQNRVVEQAEQMRLITDAVPALVSYVDREGRYQFNNKAYEEWFGRRRECVRGKHMREVLGDAAYQRLQPQVEAALAGHTVEFETTVPYEQGGSRHIHANYVPDVRPDGSVAGFCVLVNDVTNRKQGEQAASMLAEIVHSSQDAIISKNLDSIITSWNRAAERLFGYSAEEAVGRSVTMLIPEDRLQEETYILERIRQGERVESYETVRRRKDGMLVDVSLAVSPIKDSEGRVVGASKIARDITRRKAAEMALRHATAKFESVFNQSGIFAGIMDLDGHLREVNDLAVEWCGYTREQVLNRLYWETPWWRGCAQMQARIRFATEKAAAGKVFREELTYWVGDGSQRIVDFAMHPIRDESGAVICLHPTGIDITERKRAEQLVMENEKNLAKALGQRTLELTEANEALRRTEAMAVLGALAAGIAHDLTNIVFPMETRVHVLQRQDLPQPAREQVEMIARSIGYIRDLGNRIRGYMHDASRDRSGTRHASDDPSELSGGAGEALDLAQWCRSVEPFLSGLLPDAAGGADRIGLRFEIPNGLPPLTLNKTALTQAVYNLIQNSVKALRKDASGGQITLRAWQGGANHEKSGAATDVFIAVEDDGPGMTPAVLSRCLEPRFTTERNTGGTGLGLSLVKAFADSTGGEVIVHSPPPNAQRGTTVVMRFPVQARAEVADSGQGAPSRSGVMLARASLEPAHDAAGGRS